MMPPTHRMQGPGAQIELGRGWHFEPDRRGRKRDRPAEGMEVVRWIEAVGAFRWRLYLEHSSVREEGWQL